MVAIHERIDRIKNDPFGLCILNGDIMNIATRTSVSDVYSETMNVTEEIATVVDLLTPIKKKIIGADTGNHEARTYRTEGVDPMAIVVRSLGIADRYAPEGIMVFVSLCKQESIGKTVKKNRKTTYSIYATHGGGGGRKCGAKINRLADMMSIVDADIYIHSHTHLPITTKMSSFRTDHHSHTVLMVEKLFVNDSSSLEYGGYGQANEFSPTSKSSPMIHLSCNEKHCTATL